MQDVTSAKIVTTLKESWPEEPRGSFWEPSGERVFQVAGRQDPGLCAVGQGYNPSWLSSYGVEETEVWRGEVTPGHTAGKRGALVEPHLINAHPTPLGMGMGGKSHP
jgi:hypothetical protein